MELSSRALPDHAISHPEIQSKCQMNAETQSSRNSGVALSVERLGVRFGRDVVALGCVDLAFAAGAFTVLLGPSGAGKSTLLRCLNGLATPSTGQVLGPDGLPIRQRLRAHRRETAMVFQQHQLIGRLTALDNVLIGLLGQRTAWRTLLPAPRAERLRALDALERVGLLDRALQRADTLSGGQQQRVGIARALVQRPRLILADEPVASLDPVTAGQVLDLLASICRADGITAIVSLHQVDFARRYADRVVALAAGAVTFDGPPGDLGTADVARIYGARAQPAIRQKEYA
jgi:phosphonate transport system ATP-binding protein